MTGIRAGRVITCAWLLAGAWLLNVLPAVDAAVPTPDRDPFYRVPSGIKRLPNSAILDSHQLSSRVPIAEDPSWKDYVLDQDLVDGSTYPKRVYVTGAAGSVERPQALTRPGGGVTTIHSVGPGLPRLVIDLGINTGGYVELGVHSGDGSTIHLGYSEARRFLTPDGDESLDSFGADDNPPSDQPLGSLTPRSDDVVASGPARFRSPVPRGAERWISLQLQGPGTVSLDYVRVHETHRHAGLDDYTGRFLSSDDQLNRIWYASAYSFSFLTLRDLRPGYEDSRWTMVDGGKRDRLNWVDADNLAAKLGLYAIAWAPEVIEHSLQQFSCQQRSDGSLQMASEIAVNCPDDPPPAGSPAPHGAEGTNPLISEAISGADLPEWSMQWVSGVYHHYLYTGDSDFARRMMPVIGRVVDYCNRNAPDGVFNNPDPGTSPHGEDVTGLLEQVASGLYPLNWHPFDRATGTDTHTNAAYYHMLLDVARLEREVMHDDAAAADDERRAEIVRQAIVKTLWDPRAGAFIVNTEDPFPNHTQDAQVETVAYGVVSGPQADSALRFVEDKLDTPYGPMNGEYDNDPYMSNYISPYISGVQMLTHFERGETAKGYDLMRRMWGHMVDTDPNTTFWEKLAPDGDTASYTPLQAGNDVLPPNVATNRGYASLGHSWSAAAGPALSMYTLGVRPTAPGFSRWIVAPQPGDLRWAQGQVPTPAGPIVSRWQRGKGKRSFRITVRGPERTRGLVVIPQLGHGRTIARDGKVVWRHGEPAHGIRAHRTGRGVAFAQGPGTATYAWSR